MNSNATTLPIRIRAELADIAQVVERAQRLFTKAVEQQDEDYYDGVALNLHSFYTAVERILADIAREVDGAVPSGREWHRDLLAQLSVEFPGVRPRVLQHSSRHCLDEYRGLRHVIRNVYSFNLNPSRLGELVAMLPDCHKALVKDLNAFCHFLEELFPR
ncbi:hypothetical protein GS597_07660 [Synechococcales cyanobacterium C]|uniref:HepT-like domain-containing protein n=1 Tax=Petrachloros mirabilis ULC683 TaxID=2781853 RepID=A0A8K1ZYE4_9CYAN|nr:hypothetical protein [Petrachloros mirabilis]NCJ06388.1 hypothetical protein [Petrachloros mirabilis ULC683]